MVTWQERLKALMEKSRYPTVSDLAGKAGISATSLGLAMREKHIPKITTLDKIAGVLGTTSQYILYGDQRTPSQTVPVLTGAKIGLWLMGKLDPEDEETVTAPMVLGEKGFAWRCDAAEMEPVFPRGATVFFEPCSTPLPGMTVPVYVMAAIVLKQDQEGNVSLADEADTLKISIPIFRELTKGAETYCLAPADSRYKIIPLLPMEVIAKARCALVNY